MPNWTHSRCIPFTRSHRSRGLKRLNTPQQQQNISAEQAAEVAYWRDVKGMAMKTLAARMGFDSGTAIWKRWRDYQTGKLHASKPAPTTTPALSSQYPGTDLVVEHDAASLDYDGTAYRLRMRRLLRNIGVEPITRFLIRISVDRKG